MLSLLAVGLMHGQPPSTPGTIWFFSRTLENAAAHHHFVIHAPRAVIVEVARHNAEAFADRRPPASVALMLPIGLM